MVIYSELVVKFIFKKTVMLTFNETGMVTSSHCVQLTSR